MGKVVKIAPGVVGIEDDLINNEMGTAFDSQSLLFTAYNDGQVFNYDRGSILALNEMFERDGKAATLEQVLTLPVRQAPYTLRQAESRKRVVDFVSEVLLSPANNGGMTTPMNAIIAQMTAAFAYRKTFFEKVFTIRNGKVVYDKIAWRPPQTCALVRDEKTAAFNGFKQQPIRFEDTEEIYIPPNRAFVYIHNIRRDPLNGASDFDIAYWCYITKQKIRFLWYQFLEGQSLPKTIVRGRDEATANKAAAKIIGLKTGGVVGITDAVSTDVLESSGKGADQFKVALQWLDAEASGSVLAGFTDLNAAAATGTGSFALSKDQTDFFLMSQAAKAKEMADALNQWLIPDLVRYNFGSNEKSPIMEIGPLTKDDTNVAVGLLQATAVTQSPVLPREFYEELIERVAGLLELNTAKVRDGLTRAAREGAALTPQNPGVGSVAGAVGAATAAVQRATRARKPQNDPGPPPIIGADTPRIVATSRSRVR
jgi:hypothetical protein